MQREVREEELIRHVLIQSLKWRDKRNERGEKMSSEKRLGERQEGEKMEVEKSSKEGRGGEMEEVAVDGV